MLHRIAMGDRAQISGTQGYLAAALPISVDIHLHRFGLRDATIDAVA